jgi:hypothetical protein
MPTASRAWSVSQLRQRSAVADNGFSFPFARHPSSLRLAGFGTLLAGDRAGCRGVIGPVPSASLDVSGDRPLAERLYIQKWRCASDRTRGAAAGSAAAHLRDDAVSAALTESAVLLRERRAPVLDANHADVEAAAGTLDEATLDPPSPRPPHASKHSPPRLRQPPSSSHLERVIGSRTSRTAWSCRSGGYRSALSERTSSAAERRPGCRGPALEELERRGAPHRRRRSPHGHGARRRRAAPRARARRATSGRSRARSLGRPRGRRVLVSMPALVPLVILRGSGRARPSSRASRPRRRPDARPRRGRRRALRPRAADREKALALAEASLDRLGSATGSTSRSSTAAADALARLLELFATKGSRCAATSRRGSRSTSRSATSGRATRARRDGHGRVVDGLEEACGSRTSETSGLAAGSSPRTQARRALPRRLPRQPPPSGTRPRASPTASS